MGAPRSHGPWTAAWCTPIHLRRCRSTRAIASRERVPSDNEIGETWRAASEAASHYGTIIRLMILTGQRRGKVAGIRWGELSADLATWTIPRECAKNGLTHVVPLSEPARNLIRATAAGG